MGTTYSVKFIAPKGYDLMSLKKATDSRLKEINLAMSTYIPISEISQVNKAKAGEAKKISSDFSKVLVHALELAKKTDGVFDPTIGPLVNLWGFGPDGQRKVPATEKIEEARKAVGYKKVKFNIESSEVIKENDKTYIDLSASAKGFGVDEVLTLLKSRGLQNAMVEIGGEVRTSGRSLTRPWKIGVESPNPDDLEQKIMKVVKIENFALATSGDYRNFFKSNGKRYSHTINYKTGKPVENTLASVSVISDTCMDADAVATALMAMGSEKGYQFAVKNDIKAFFISRAEDGSRNFVLRSTAGFESAVAK